MHVMSKLGVELPLHKEQKMGMWALIFSSFYFFPLLAQKAPVSVVDVIAQVAVYMLFIAFYLTALYQKGPRLTGILLLMMLTCGLGTMLTYGTQSIFGYVGFFCGLCYRLAQGLIMMAMLMSALLLTGFLFANESLWYFCLPAFVVGGGLFALGVIGRKDQIHRLQHRQSQQQIQQLAAIAERERIARDLHDLLGHSLSSIALKAELATKLQQLGQHGQAIQESLEVASIARSLLSEVREAVSGLKQIGLDAQLKALQQRLAQAGFNVFIENQAPSLSAQQESALCYIAKEAVTNILRHSKAKNVKVALMQQDNVVLFRIEDDGDIKNLTHGNGLEGIKERALQLGAKLHVDISHGLKLQLTMEQSVNESHGG
ncbi:Sensor histidine kinase DesK [Pseudoalteromonas sp. CIP111854]|uniref:Sensor histidine kinase DesK n=1 Tax=Pseudoalteromonas holothuriae TaxID=2963714 RepID=A0A9W4VP15_9GAMM|nr:sensor histidine kinase [Pseudoalteromonas sp. CIP111854]CAH9054686.1 Sensor histidine kinase DesK [Pseudoalteromonas sp. CIP111854]